MSTVDGAAVVKHVFSDATANCGDRNDAALVTGHYRQLTSAEMTAENHAVSFDGKSENVKLRLCNNVNNNSTSLDLENWMSKLQYRYAPIHGIAIPGSHGSFSYSLSKGSRISPDHRLYPILHKLPLIRAIFTTFIYRWYRTQSLTAKEQLKNGIRFFEIKTAKRQNSPDYLIVHGLYGQRVLRLLQEVKEFAQMHPKEITILDFNDFYNFEHADHDRLQREIVEVFGSMLCPVDDFEDVTLSYLWNHGHNIIAFYRYGYLVPTTSRLLWPPTRIQRCGKETASSIKMVAHLDECYQSTKRRQSNSIYVNEGNLTPRSKCVLRNICRSTKGKLAPNANSALLNWLNDKMAGESEINVVCADFVEMKPYRLAEQIIRLNDRRASIHRQSDILRRLSEQRDLGNADFSSL